MFGTNPSDRGLINAGLLTFATLLADSFSPTRPATDSPHPREARVIRRYGWLQRLVAWGTRPLAGSATDAATRLEITALRGLRR